MPAFQKERRVLMKKIAAAFAGLVSVAALQLPAFAGDWQKIEAKAKGQTVYFNAWGGGDVINAYIDWAAGEAEKRFGFKVVHVKIADAADAVKRIETEVTAGRKNEGGSVDLIWINGENFRMMKSAGLLHGPWAGGLPNRSLVDETLPVNVDFSEPVDGLESPWGTAKLTFMADSALVPKLPKSADALLAFAKANPGKVSYPRPPDFHGTTFLKQILLSQSPDPSVFAKPVDKADFAKETKPLWDWLDSFHPAAWRAGKDFPKSAADMNRMLADRELMLSLTFNPNEGANLVANGQLPPTTVSFGFDDGTIGNVHFLAIPANANAKEAAQVFADFLLSPEAQGRKADIANWGDGTVLDLARLDPAAKAAFQAVPKGGLTDAVPTLAEPHASWVGAIEAEWLKRYGG